MKTTVDQALQVARDLHQERKEGLPDRQWAELTPDVVLWLAELALRHPQVSAAVAAALPSSGVRWAMPWSERDVRVDESGSVVGALRRGFTYSWSVWPDETATDAGDSETSDAARAEVDERLEAAGYTLLGEVYRRAGEP